MARNAGMRASAQPPTANRFRKCISRRIAQKCAELDWRRGNYALTMNEPVMLSRARRMRKDATDAERRIWALVRNRRLDGYKFRRQIWIGPFIADFVCEQPQLIVEIDGGQHSMQLSYDVARTRYFKARGYRVIRYWNNDVLARTEAVAESLRQALRAINQAPSSVKKSG
jgi:very-short-patch-repair endonuclease